MRHRHSGKRFGMTAAHRKAMFANMSVSLLTHESIRTTLARAKELRRVVEPLITVSRQDSVAARRRVFAKLRDRNVVTKLFADIGPGYAGRPGGYLRVLKCGFRSGDQAPMALVKLVDRPKESESAEKDESS